MAADLEAFACAVYDGHEDYTEDDPLYALVGYTDQGMIPIYLRAPQEGIVWPWVPDNSVAVETRTPISNELAVNLGALLDNPGARDKVTNERGRTDLTVDLDVDWGVLSVLPAHEAHLFKLIVDLLETDGRALSTGMQHFLRAML